MTALAVAVVTPAAAQTTIGAGGGGIIQSWGNVYALFLSTLGLSGTGRIQWETATSDEYGGGTSVFLNNGENTADWTTSPWASYEGPAIRVRGHQGSVL